MKRRLLVIFLFCMGMSLATHAQTEKKHYSIKGFVYEHKTGKPIEMAYVTLPDLTQWGTTDSGGKFVINRIIPGTTTVEISCLGYQTIKMDINIERDLDSLIFRMKEENL